jgi:hypothetical protein
MRPAKTRRKTVQRAGGPGAAVVEEVVAMADASAVPAALALLALLVAILVAAALTR